MEEACKSLKLVRFFIFSPLSFSSRRFFFVGIILSHRFHRFTQIFYGISGESLCPVSGGICNDRTGRICENPWVIVTAGNLRINSVSSDDEKNLRHLRNLRDLKNVPINICVYLWNLWDKKIRWKNLCKSVKSVGLFPTSGGYLQRPDRSHLRNLRD